MMLIDHDFLGVAENRTFKKIVAYQTLVGCSESLVKMWNHCVVAMTERFLLRLYESLVLKLPGLFVCLFILLRTLALTCEYTVMN